jgi:DNA-binding transcriptional LysR family regulator
MDRLDAMALFVTVAEAGSLAAAARRHGRSPATVTRAVALLERDVGEPLLLRSTRHLSLTAAGERYRAVWRDVLAQLAAVRAAPGAALDGEITLTAPELFGQMAVMPLVEAFLRDHVRVSARVLLVNRVVNLVAEGIDLAVRLAPLPDSGLTAVALGHVRALHCASPDYLAARGRPATPRELAAHDCIGLNTGGDAESWGFGPGTRGRAVRVPTRLSVNSAAAAIDAALRGCGIVAARSYQVAAHLAEGRLVRLLSDHEAPPVPAHLVFAAERARGGAVRGFIDAAVPALRRRLAEVEAMLPPA